MNTKEVIELVEHAFCAWESEYCCGNEEIKALRDELKQVIIVIEQGDKYKQMWEELDDFIGYSDYDILQKMKELIYGMLSHNDYKTLNLSGKTYNITLRLSIVPEVPKRIYTDDMGYFTQEENTKTKNSSSEKKIQVVK